LFRLRRRHEIVAGHSRGLRRACAGPEFRIVDAARASFGVVDRERALTNVVSHGAISVLGNRRSPRPAPPTRSRSAGPSTS